MTSCWRACALGCAALLAATTSWAQSDSAKAAALARNGPVAGIAWSPVSVSIGDAPASRNGGVGLYFGVRLTPPPWLCDSTRSGACVLVRRFQVTPHVSIAATHLRGLNPSTDEYTFSFVEKLGLKLAYPVLPRFRLTGIWRNGNRAAELFENNDIVNRWGPGTTLGGGIEIPFTGEGRGIEIALLRISGHFEKVEVRDLSRNEKLILDDRLSFRASALQIGWSGPFTGVSLPWR